MSATSIVESSSAPDTASWQVVRTEFQSLQSEVSELKKQLEKAKSNSPEKPPATAKKQEDEDSSKPVTVQQKVLGL